MRLSNYFGRTLREAPADSESISHQLLLRAGFIRPMGSGLFSYLHLAQRSMTKIKNIIRHELDRIGGQEITMPIVQTASIWKETKRWYQIGQEMARFTDRNRHELLLAMTHEEALSDLVRKEIHSYKQLPKLLYHIQTKFRDEPRPRAGLIRAREFTMADSYSLAADWEELDRQYNAHYKAYKNIFSLCGLEILPVMSDSGIMGGDTAHEFMYLTPNGEDTLVICDTCGYTANLQVACFRKTSAPKEALAPIKKVHTPDCKTIEDLSAFLRIPRSKILKAVFFFATIANAEENKEKFIFALIRGDLEVNETKLSKTIGATSLRPATEEEVKSTGAEPGYGSPIGVTKDNHMLVIMDETIIDSPNLVAGANEPDYHYRDTNAYRDYLPDVVTDLASAEDGHACPKCSHTLHLKRGVEVGNIFKLGTHYSEAMHCTYINKDGQENLIIMGSYGIGIGRLLACVAEQHHDKNGLTWPITIAPYQVHLVLLRGKQSLDAEVLAEKLYMDLLNAGIEVLYDDRDESPGEKYHDADLIGLPLRITISSRSLQQGGAEIKLRCKR